MKTAHLLLPALGLAWTFVAIVVAHARQRGISVFHFLMCGSFFSFLIFLGINLFWGMENFFAPQYRLAVVMLILGAVFNSSCQMVAMYNLKQGGRALAFAIPQLSFIMPYAWSIIFRGERFALTGAAGLLCISGAICFLAMKKNTAQSGAVSSALEPKRILIAFAAMFTGGCSQIFFSYPALLPQEQRVSTLTGSLIIQVISMLVYLIFSLFTPVKFIDGIKKTLKYSVLWAVGAVASYCVLLPALEEMSKLKQTGIVYPAACSMLILLFALYTAIRYKEKLSGSQTAAFLAIIAGIFLIRL